MVLHFSWGTLRYSGKNRLALEIDQGLADFYRNLIPKYMTVQRPRWGAHVTVVREEKEEPLIWDLWGKYEGEEVPFFYSPEIKHGKIYYWLDVFCVRLEEIRRELGLPCISQYTLPPEGFQKCFHCTIANRK